MSAVPEGWEERVSKSSGRTYYLNLLTKESQWEMPTEPAEGFSNDQVKVSEPESDQTSPVKLVHSYLFIHTYT